MGKKYNKEMVEMWRALRDVYRKVFRLNPHAESFPPWCFSWDEVDRWAIQNKYDTDNVVFADGALTQDIINELDDALCRVKSQLDDTLCRVKSQLDDLKLRITALEEYINNGEKK